MKVLPLLRPRYLIRQCVANARPPTAVMSMMWPSTPPERRYARRCSPTQSRRPAEIAEEDSLLCGISPRGALIGVRVASWLLYFNSTGVASPGGLKHGKAYCRE